TLEGNGVFVSSFHTSTASPTRKLLTGFSLPSAISRNCAAFSWPDSCLYFERCAVRFVLPGCEYYWHIHKLCFHTRRRAPFLKRINGSLIQHRVTTALKHRYGTYAAVLLVNSRTKNCPAFEPAGAARVRWNRGINEYDALLSLKNHVI